MDWATCRRLFRGPFSSLRWARCVSNWYKIRHLPFCSYCLSVLTDTGSPSAPAPRVGALSTVHAPTKRSGRRTVVDVHAGRRPMVLSVARARACAVRAHAWLHVGGRDISGTAESCASERHSGTRPTCRRATVAFTRTTLSRSREIASPVRLHRVLSDLYTMCTNYSRNEPLRVCARA